jgi:hypothetical protein
MKLESTSYYQRFRPLDDYIDEFQDLVAESGYTDPMTVVVKFRRGLNPQVQTAVAWTGRRTQTWIAGTLWPGWWMRTGLRTRSSSLPADHQHRRRFAHPACSPSGPPSPSCRRHLHSHQLMCPDKPITWEVPQHQWVQTQAEDVSFRTQTVENSR